MAPLSLTFPPPGPIMRFVVLILVLLAGFKVWTQDRMYRSVVGEALVGAYRDRAIEVCRKQTAKTVPVASARTVSDLWSVSSPAEITLGASDVDVAVWDTQNPLWQQRFRNPHLVLTGTGQSSRLRGPDRRTRVGGCQTSTRGCSGRRGCADRTNGQHNHRCQD